jgi:AcrR family transcriptional regulator
LNRGAVVDAAIEIITRDGPDELTMRSLASALGAAPTAVYWHVGDKDAVLDAVAERLVVDISHLEPEGDTLTERIVSIGMKLRVFLRSSNPLVGVAHQRGRTAHLLHPARRMVVHELLDAGVAPDQAAFATEAVLYLVSGSVLTDLAVARSPERTPHTELWQPDDVAGAADPAKLLAALTTSTPPDELFERTLTAMLTGLL